MDIVRNLDPDLAAVLELIPEGGLLDWEDLPSMRAARLEAMHELAASTPDRVVKEDRTVPGPAGAPEVAVRVYRPHEVQSVLPGLLWIHGGGYVMGTIDLDDARIQEVVEQVGCVAVSVEYRLAPEFPFPSGLDDCYAALQWMVDNADELGLDRSRVAVGGASAGGGLAAAVALVARDRGEIDLAFQLLIYPMLDDRQVVRAATRTTDAPVWRCEDNRNGWRAYLGCDPGAVDVSPYAAPARATDLTGLPPTYVTVGELDLFLEENIDYAQRLLGAGVSTELHVIPGAFHGFDALVPDSAVAALLAAERVRVLTRAFQGAHTPLRPA